MNGKTFEQFKPGDRYVTGRRTITEHDILQFVGLVGLTEPLFLDLEYIRKESLYGERIAPGSLTFGMAEGLTVQTGLIHGTGLAFAGLDKMRLFGPVKVGDTIQKGQQIGVSGSTGMAFGDHVHFSMLIAGIQVNPIEWWDEHWIHDRILSKIGPHEPSSPAVPSRKALRRSSRR